MLSKVPKRHLCCCSTVTAMFYGQDPSAQIISTMNSDKSDKDEKKNKAKKKIGVLELCSALNSDDANVIRKALVKFTLQVRNERKFAFSLDEINNEDKIEDEEEEEEIATTSKINKPRWAQDVKQYNVPFVATSLSFGGDEGFVQKGQWPTGLLEAYLAASPRAIELFAAFHQNKDEKDVSFQKAFWFAISELITAFHRPAATDKNTSTLQHSPVIFEVLRNECLPEMLHQIEAKYGCSTTKKKNKRKRDPIILTKKEDGAIPAILYCLAQLLTIPTATIAIDVARKLSSLFINNNNMLSSMLLQPKDEEETDYRQPKYNQNHPELHHYFSSIQPQKLNVSTGCILIASAMLFMIHQKQQQQQKLFLFSSMINSGKTTTTSAGMAYVCYQLGFNHILTCSSNYFFAIAQFLVAIRETCAICDTMGSHYSIIVLNKLKCDFFSSKGLVSIAKLAAAYTPSSRHSFSLQENSSDAVMLLSPMQIASMEARRLLLLLIEDKNHSPLFYPILNDTTTHHPHLSILQHQHQLSLISKALLAITNPATARLLQEASIMRQTILRCFHQTPNIVPFYFKSIMPSLIASAGNNKNIIISSIAFLSHLTHLISESPSVVKCLNAPWNNCPVEYDTATDSRVPDSLWMCIYPTNCLTKVLILKLLSSSSSLIVMGTLKLMTSILQRCAELINSEEDIAFFRPDRQLMEETLVKKLLPEVSWLLSFLRSKLVLLFSTPPEEYLFFVVLQICDTLCTYYSTFLISTKNADNNNNVDAIGKLLALVVVVEEPRHQQKQESERQQDTDLLFNTSVLLQYRILRVMECFSMSPKSLLRSDSHQQHFLTDSSEYRLLVKCSPITFGLLIQIATATRHTVIRYLCRRLIEGSLMQLNHHVGVPGDKENMWNTNEQRKCLYYEATLWTDMILSFVPTNEVETQSNNQTILSCMVKTYEIVRKRFMEHFIYAAQACIIVDEGDDGIKKQHEDCTTLLYCFSPFLNFSLNGLSQFPPEFRHCVLLVTCKCLFFHTDPTPLALLVILHLDTSSSHRGECDSSLSSDALLNYSRQIVKLGNKGWAERNQTLSFSSSCSSLLSSLTDVMENILQRNNSDQLLYPDLFVCKLFVSTHPKVQQESRIAGQEMTLRNYSGSLAVSVTRQILHHLKFFTNSTKASDRRDAVLQKSPYNHHVFALLRCAIVSAMNDCFAFQSVITAIYDSDFFSEIQCSNRLILLCVSLCCLNQLSSLHGSLLFMDTKLHLIIGKCLNGYTKSLCNWILSEHENPLDSYTTYRSLSFLVAIGGNLPSTSGISLASALFRRANGNLNSLEQHQQGIKTNNNWIFRELYFLLQGFLLTSNDSYNVLLDRSIITFYENVLSLWKTLNSYTSDEDIIINYGPFATKVLTQLENIICYSLNNSDHNAVGSSTFLNFTATYPDEMFNCLYRSMRRTFLQSRQNDEGDTFRSTSIMVALFSFDCCNANLTSLFRYLSESTAPEIIEKDAIWEAGVLDSLMEFIFCEKMKEFLREQVYIYPVAFHIFARRMIYIFSSKAANNEGHTKLKCARSCSFLLNVLFDLNDAELPLNIQRTTLTTAMFDCLVAQLPRILRKRPHTNSSTISPGSKATKSNGSFNGDAVFVAKMLQDVLHSSEAEICIARCNIDHIVKLLFVCLKNGINAAKDSSLLASECLKIIHLIISICQNVSSTATLLERGNPLDVTRIHEMMVMHSQYEVVMSLMPRNAPSPKLELIKLQICCIMASKGSIVRQISTRNILLQSHHAGICPEDCFLRRLIHLYYSRKIENTVEWFMDELRTGPTGIYSENAEGERWDWLLTLLDHNRIRCTLAYFPDWEPRLWPLDNEKVADVVSTDIVSQIDNDDGIDGDDSETQSAGSDDIESYSLNLMPADKSSTIRKWPSEEGPDMRYSPSFVLPLVLGFLEYYLPTEEELLAQPLEDKNTETSVKAFSKMTFKLCESGGISLALASLSCKCPAIRQIAVAILFLVMKAMRTDEARRISEWKHRPQVLMLLESVQKGLRLRRQRQMSSPLPPSSTVSPRCIVPMFSSVSAIFLARAFTILCNPSDPMYSSMNSYFLRIASNQGAFKDSGGRIPAFTSFYCSTDDSGGTAKRERQWMLFLLRDAVKDRHSFKAAIRCHATSLLLSNVDSPTSSFSGSNDDTERVAVILTLESMVRNGGELSASHFLSQMGLLSWLHCFLVSRDLSKVLPSLKARVAFLKLISAAIHVIEQTKRHKWNNIRDSIIEIISLSGSALELVAATLYQISAGDVSIRRDSKTERLFFALIPTCFWGMHTIFVGNKVNRRGMNRGISLDSATAVLSNVKLYFEGDREAEVSDFDDSNFDGTSKLTKLALSLSSLPFRSEAVSRLKELCLMTFSIVLENSEELSVDSLACVLHRIAAYASTDVGTSDAVAPSIIADVDMLQMVMRCRRKCVGNETAMEAWKTCMTSLVPNGDPSEDTASGKDVLINTVKSLIRCS